MIVDAYRALELLAKHRQIDPARIVVMGFSRGGRSSLYSSLTRFQRMHGPAGLQFAAHVGLYAPCGIRKLRCLVSYQEFERLMRASGVECGYPQEALDDILLSLDLIERKHGGWDKEIDVIG
jgi:hypothetical protein